MLHVKETKYNITIDAKGKELAALDGKEAKVTGTVKEKEGAKWLTVASFEEVKGDSAEAKSTTEEVRPV